MNERGQHGAPLRLRSLLFTPATSPERAAKLPGLGADAGIVDLEDSVPASHKEGARRLAREVSESLVRTAPGFTLFVRVNPVDSEWFAGDVDEALIDGISGVVVPKVNSSEALRSARLALDRRGLTTCSIVIGIETGRAVLDARRILETGLASAAYFGAEDFVADVGGVRTEGGLEVLYARSHIALAASITGVSAIDEIVADFSDDERFRGDAAFGRSLGYSGKLCIHPRQVLLANAAFTPSAAEVEHARRIVEAYAAAGQHGAGAINFDGEMIDEPIARRARAVLAAAGEGS